MQKENTHTQALSELIAEIRSLNWIKDNPQLLDESSVARWVYLELKGFGRSLMDQHEEVIHIDNYRGEMPPNFSSLNLAVYCEPDFVSVPKGVDPIKIQTRLIGERITTPEVVLCTDCTPVEDSSRCQERVVENIYVDATEVSINYRNFQYVKLGKDLIRDHCSAECVNRMVKDSPYEINIKGTTVYSGFRKGSLYVRYYGLPMDDNGLPLIPKTQNGFLEKYLEIYIKRRILEDAIMSKDISNLQFMYGEFLRQEEDMLPKAKADISKITTAALFRAIDNNRKRMLKYSVNLGRLTSNRFDNLGYHYNTNNY